MPGGNTAYEQAQADARKKAADRANQARVQAQENSRRATAKANSAKIIAAQNKREAASRTNAREKAREVSARAVASRAKEKREQSARIVASENAKRATAKKNASRIQAAQNQAQAKREQKAEENRQDRNRQENEAAKATAIKQAEEGRRDQEARNRADETGSAQADANRRDREKREREIALQANEFASAEKTRQDLALAKVREDSAREQYRIGGLSADEIDKERKQIKRQRDLENRLKSQEFASATSSQNKRLKDERDRLARASEESGISLETIATSNEKRIQKMREDAKTAANLDHAKRADDEGTKIIEE